MQIKKVFVLWEVWPQICQGKQASLKSAPTGAGRTRASIRKYFHRPSPNGDSVAKFHHNNNLLGKFEALLRKLSGGVLMCGPTLILATVTDSRQNPASFAFQHLGPDGRGQARFNWLVQLGSPPLEHRGMLSQACSVSRGKFLLLPQRRRR